MSRDKDNDLAEALCGLTCAIAGLARGLENSNNNQAVLHRIAEMEKRIVAAIETSDEDQRILCALLSESERITLRLERLASDISLNHP